MQRTLAVALLVVVAAHPAAAQDGQAIEFAPPAQLGGAFNGTGLSWVLVPFSGGPAQVSFRFPGEVAYTNQSILQATRINGYAFNVTTGSDQYPPAFPSTLHNLEGEANATGQGGLFVAGRDLRVRLSASSGVLLAKPRGVCTNGLLTPAEQADHPADSHCSPRDEAAVRMEGAGAPISFIIEAGGPLMVEWRGANVTCASGSSCPGGGGSKSVTVPLPFGASSKSTLFWFTNLEGNGNVTASGSAAAVLAGGSLFDLEGNGWMRLPGARSAPGRCPASGCFDPANRTLWAKGDVALHRIRAMESGKVGAEVGGNPTTVLLDEQAVSSPFAQAGLGLGLAAATGAGLALWKFVAFLLSHRGAVSPRRQEVLKAIQDNPGIHFRALERLTSIAPTPLLHHVRRLCEEGLVVRRRHGNTVRLFENHGRYGPEWKALALLRDPRARRLHDWVAQDPGRSRQDATRQAASWGIGRSSAYRLLRALERAGLLADEGGQLHALSPIPPSAAGG